MILQKLLLIQCFMLDHVNTCLDHEKYRDCLYRNANIG
jgi:hypothetical protein